MIHEKWDFLIYDMSKHLQPKEVGRVINGYNILAFGSLSQFIFSTNFYDFENYNLN